MEKDGVSLHLRNIPAYAGKTPCRMVDFYFSREHPRVCGENAVWNCTRAAAKGTSPRMRGKRADQNRWHKAFRNIPAYAGKTGLALFVISLIQEHPRVCGENNESHCHLLSLIGTSPRMRGKPGTAEPGKGNRRNIPAYAGKTRTGRPVTVAAWEHPRVCGENSPILRRKHEWVGTSPRMRGKRIGVLSPSCCIRNIPAYAGKTKMQVK